MEAARFALEYLALDRLYLIPTGIPPHKRMGADAPEAAQRLEMVRLAAEALGPAVQVDDLELRREGRSYTLDTLRQLKKAHPKDALYLLMGTDMFLTFHRWREPGEIAKLCTLCAFGRSEKDSEELFSVQRAYLRETLGADVVTIALPHIVDISSTRLREHLAAPSSISLLETSGRGHSAPVDVPLACILYAQCFDHAIDVHTTSGVYRTRQSFQDFTAQLPHTGRFYVCGRGLVVNLSQVTRVLEHDLLLKNGDRISFSRNRRREIQKAYADWFADRTRKGGWAK